MTDKNKASFRLIKQLLEEIARQNDKINILQVSNSTLKLLIDKQFQLLCTYANLCRKEERSESDTNYIELKNLLKEYGYDNLSYTLLKEVKSTKYNYEGLYQ